MGVTYEYLLKPLLFKLDPEKAHELAVDCMKALSRLPTFCRALASFNQLSSSAKNIEAFGLEFPNRVGLAAGFDKNAVCWPAFEALGFGHVEVGTVTLKAQPGNERPRCFRYPEQEALLNRMGFNNDGAQSVAARFDRMPGRENRRIPLGVNIGKSKSASLDDAVADYRGSFDLLAEYADYVVINVSSPNTPDLRKLQEEDRLRELLQELCRLNEYRAEAPETSRKPILLKIAPDLNNDQLDSILQILFDLKLDGIIAANTTMAREGPFEGVDQAGGISGKPVDEMSTTMIEQIYNRSNGELPIVGVGGIRDMDSAKRKLDAGATLLQIYTGLVYEGPFLAKRLAKRIAIRQGDLS